MVSDSTHARLFSPEQPDAGARMMEQMFRHTDEARRLATAGQMRARELSWDKTVDQMVAVLTQVVPGV